MNRGLQQYFISLIVVFLFVQCSPEDPRHPRIQAIHHLDSLNALLLKELSNKRIVVFGDMSRGDVVYDRCVTAFLEYWLDSLQSGRSNAVPPRRLTLALELGELGARALNDYLRTGDRYVLMRFLIDEKARLGIGSNRTWALSVNYLQFYERLRLIRMRIDTLNRQCAGDSVFFEIVGPEPDPPYSMFDIRSKSQGEFWAMKSHWDANERDRETSMRLMQYLSRHPDHTILVFSGLMHTVRDSKDGYFLARRLDSLMGRSNVSVFQTSLMLNGLAPGTRIEEYSHRGESPDFLVRNPAVPSSSLPFFLVKTQNTFRALVDLAEGYDASTDTLERELSLKMLSLSLELLRRSHLALDPARSYEIASLQAAVAAATRKAITAPQTFAHIRRIISRFDAVRDVLEIDSVMITFAPSVDFRNDLTTLIDNLGGSVSAAPSNRWVTVQQPIDTITAKWTRAWKERKSEIHSYMLLQILWLGTPNEVGNAMVALKRETGQDFSSQLQWEEWWESRRQ